MARKRFWLNLNSRNDSIIREKLHEGPPVLCLLVEGFMEEDDSTDCGGNSGSIGREQQLPAKLKVKVVRFGMDCSIIFLAPTSVASQEINCTFWKAH